ncbi:MAG: hypothetical protein EOO28_21985, partial [Comamonadaceae bacterium]
MKSHAQRKIVALMSIQLFLGACSATAQPQPQNGSQHWPQPKPWTRPQPVSVQPNFQAPSATHCARPIETKELPGMMQQRPSPAGRGAFGDSPREDARPAIRKAAPAAPVTTHEERATGSASAGAFTAEPPAGLSAGTAADRSRRESYLPPPFPLP